MNLDKILAWAAAELVAGRSITIIQPAGHKEIGMLVIAGDRITTLTFDAQTQDLQQTNLLPPTE